MRSATGWHYCSSTGRWLADGRIAWGRSLNDEAAPFEAKEG